MTIEEMEARIAELESERDFLKSKIRELKKKFVPCIPDESINLHPWADAVFDKCAHLSDIRRQEISHIVRFVLFGRKPVKLLNMNDEQIDKYNHAIEKVLCALDEYVCDEWVYWRDSI